MLVFNKWFTISKFSNRGIIMENDQDPRIDQVEGDECCQDTGVFTADCKKKQSARPAAQVSELGVDKKTNQTALFKTGCKKNQSPDTNPGKKTTIEILEEKFEPGTNRMTITVKAKCL